MNKKMLRNEIFVVMYVIAFFLCSIQIGSVKKITSYNVSGVNSVTASHLVKEYKEPVVETKPTVYKYRLTSYWPGDDCNSGLCTGTGLCAKDFQVNSKGWYTYKGKIVVAAATPYLVNRFGYKENKVYYKYYDEIKLNIDGKVYDGIILDTCGACYKNEILDIFVTNKQSVIDRGYKGINMVDVEITKKQ